MIQGTAESVYKKIPAFDPSKGPFDKFLAFHIRTGANRAYESLKNPSSQIKVSAYVYKRAKMIQPDLDKGQSIEEIAEKWHIRKSTVLNYMNVLSKSISLDAQDVNGHNLHEKIRMEEKTDSYPDLSGLTELERFVVKTYLAHSNERNWKKATIEVCAQRGISQKKTMDIIKHARTSNKKAE